MSKPNNILSGSSYLRNFNIITNQIKSSTKSVHRPSIFPKIQSKLHNSTIVDRSRHKTLNGSGYDYDIINQRKNNRSLMVRDRSRDQNMNLDYGEHGAKRAYHLTRFKEEADISAIRYRKGYQEVTKDKTFNKKKGWIKQYIGDQVNTINHCLKRL